MNFFRMRQYEFWIVWLVFVAGGLGGFRTISQAQDQEIENGGISGEGRDFTASVHLQWHLDDSKKRPPLVIVDVLATKRVPGDFEFVKSPTPLPFYVELRTASGDLLKAKGIYRNLRTGFPLQIHSEKLRRSPWSHTLSDLLTFHVDSPTLLGSFNVSDLFPDARKGAYVLTIWPMMYHFSGPRNTVKRVDLTPVSVSIQLS